MKCKPHIIGNKSKEIYEWESDNSIPYKHYLLFKCKNCGSNITRWFEDSKVKDKIEW